MSDFAEAIALERHEAAHVPHVRNRQRRRNAVLASLLVGVVALAPLPLGSNRPFFWALWAAVLGAIGVAYLILLLSKGERLRVSLGQLWLPAALFLALCAVLVAQLLPLSPAGFGFPAGVVSRTLSLASGATWLMLLQMLTYGLFFFLMLQVAANRSRGRKLGAAILFVITAYALYGLVALVLLDDSLLFFDKWAYAGFATGPFVNRNSFATFLAFGLVLGVLLALRELIGGGKGRAGLGPIYLASTGLILAALLATGSRMGLFAGLAGAGCGALMVARKAGIGKGTLRWALIGGLPILAAIALLLLYGASTFDRLGSLETDANVRGDLYAQVFGMIAARPWLGYGGGAFELAYPLFHQLPVSADLVWDKAHSSYLGLWAELGIVAGSLPLLILVVIAIDALRLYLGRRGDWTAPAAAVCVSIVAALHSIVDFSLEMEANVLVFLAILAIGVARGPEKSTSSDETAA